MKNVCLFFILGMLMYSCNQSPNQTGTGQADSEIISETPVRDGVFIHISSGYEDPHRALMALKMASMMAIDKDVLVYLDIHAVDFLVKGANELNHPGFETAHTYIKELISKNVGVYACPTCLAVAGFKAEDLMEGVQTAQKDKFFDFTKGRIITLDY
jgi:predicted peroxiredoxin